MGVAHGRQPGPCFARYFADDVPGERRDRAPRIRGIQSARRRWFLSYLDAAFELHSAIIGGAEGKVYRGHNGLREWLADSDESFDDLRIEPTEFRDLGDRVLVLGHIRARGRESGLELDSPTGWVCTVRDGKLVTTEGFLSRAEALEAVGLRE